MEVKQHSKVEATHSQPTGPIQIPAEWHLKRLGEIASIHDGTHQTPHYTDAGVPFYSVEQVTSNDFESTKFISEAEFARLSKSSRIERGDVLMTRIGSIGDCKFVDWDARAGYYVSLALLKFKNSTLASYFAHYSRTTAFKQEIELHSLAHAIPRKINLGPISHIRLPVPPRAEQIAIAANLSDADALIDSLEQLLTKKRQIKQGAMQELLTGKRRLPGFQQSWSEVRLGDVGRTYGGLTGKGKADFGHGASKYVTFMNVMTTVRTSTEMVESVEVGVSESQNMVQPGDLLFNGSSETPEEVALCSWVETCDEGVFLNSFCFGFRPFATDRLSGLFMAYFFRGRPGRAAVSSLAQGATRYNIAKTALLQAPLRLPTFAEQQAIAEVLSSMDAQITALESRLTKARALKQAMAQALLTGRIRLVELTA